MQMLLIWLVKLSLSSISTPSNLICEVLAMIWSSICRASVCLSESMFLGLIVRHWNFSVLASRKLSLYHDMANFPWYCSLEEAMFWFDPVTYSWWSSAYMKRFVYLTNMVMSFWNKFHNNGPNEDPWEQPRDILDHSLLIVPSFTRLYLSFRNDRIRSNDWLVNPYALSFLMTKLWHRESKALLMSVDRMVTNSFLSIACFQSSVSLTSVVSQLWFFLYNLWLDFDGPDEWKL